MLGLYYMPALCYNAATKFQCINGLSYTHYFECSIRVCFTCIYTLYFKLPKMFYLSQLFINSIYLLFAIGTGLAAVYILYTFTCTFNTQKQLLINARMN